MPSACSVRRTNVEKNSAVAPRFVRELAAYYKDKRNYDKAYLFYKEWLQYNPEDVSGLVACAEMQMMRGETKDALKLYEKVLTLDAHYRNGLSDVFSNGYGKAKGYLQKVLQLFPSTEAGKTLDKIKKMELELK